MRPALARINWLKQLLLEFSVMMLDQSGYSRKRSGPGNSGIAIKKNNHESTKARKHEKHKEIFLY